MPAITVEASTSVVYIDSATLGPGDTAIVYLSSLTPPGRSVAIRDSAGYLSSPQSIRVSTTAGITFADGTNQIEFNQAFGSVVVSSRDATTWNLVNTFGFPLYDTIANVGDLTASTLTGTTLQISGALSSGSVQTNSLEVLSTGYVGGPLFASTLVVNADPAVAPRPYDTYPGYSAYIMGATYIGGPVNAGDISAASVTAAGALSVGSNAVIGGSLTLAGNASIGGNLTTLGTATLTATTATIGSTLTVLGPLVANSNVTIQSNLQVNGQLTTAQAQTSSLFINAAAGGYFQFNAPIGPEMRLRTDIVPGNPTVAWNAPLYTPLFSTGIVQASTVAVQVLQITSTLSAPTLQQVAFSSAVITNPNGSLTISSITANTFVLSNALVVDTFQTSSLQTSSLTATSAIQGTGPTSYISAGTVAASTVNATQLSTGVAYAGVIQTPAITLSTLTVGESIQGTSAATVFSMPAATAQIGTIYTTALQASTVTASTFVASGGLIQAPSTLTFFTSTVQFQTASMSSLSVSSATISTLTASKLILGTDPTVPAAGPDFTVSSPALSTNVLVSGGPGNYLQPYFLSNVIPPGQNPLVAYSTFIRFEADYHANPPPPGMVIEYTASLFWAGQQFSYLSLPDGGPTLYGTALADQTVSGTIANSTFSILAGLFGNSAVSVNFKFRYTPNANSVDSNVILNFNNGVLRWPYALNGTTIQNSLNDAAVRNLYYYGTLNFASDPRLKTDIRDADLGRCVDILRELPMHTYRYTDEYCSTFQVPATQRLGFLATEVGRIFPHSVHPTEVLPGAPPALTIDTAQIDMAHIGATKQLLQTVERLEAQLAALLENKL